MNWLRGFYNKNYYIAIILFLVCFIVYFNSLKGQFVFDDIGGIVNNKDVYKVDLLRPQSYFYALAASFKPLNPIPFHIISVTLHFINSFLVYLLLSSYYVFYAALAGALIFAVHPVHTEAVSWISGSGYVIFGMYVFSILLLLRKGIKLDIKYLIAFILFVHINHSTWWAFTLPLTILAFHSSWKNLLYLSPFFIDTVIRIVESSVARSERIIATAQSTLYIPEQKITYMIHSICSGLWMTFFPFNLTIFHNPEIEEITRIQFALELLFVMNLIFSLNYLYNKSRVLFGSVCLFLITLIPTYSPIPICWVTAERYLYVPSVMLSFIVAYLVSIYLQNGSKKRGL